MVRAHRQLGLVGVLLIALAAVSQDSARHNLNGQGCATCHVDRGPAPAVQSVGCDSALLWDCQLPSRSFQTYDSLSSEAKAAQAGSPGTSNDDLQMRLSSMLCASCHDGVSTATMNRADKSGAYRSSLSAEGLRNEHPVDIPHDPVKDPSLAAVSVVRRQVKLFGPANKVQCTTCHEVHEDQGNNDPDLLRAPTRGSSLCVTCHL